MDAHTGAWWQSAPALNRWTRDVLCGEMAQLRPGGWPWPLGPIPAPGMDRTNRVPPSDVHLVDDAGADSLELMALASAWAERLDLQDPIALERLMREPTAQAWATLAHDRLSQNGHDPVRFLSSGSSGRAHPVMHSMAELLEEVACIRERLLRGGLVIRRIVSAVRSHHIYGFLFTLLLPRALADGPAPEWRATESLPVLDVVGSPPSVVRRQVQAGDLVVAFPDWWSIAVRDGALWPSGIAGVSSTAPCPTATAHGAIALGLTRWVEVYGSTETAGVGWREDPEAPFELQPYWRRVEDRRMTALDAAPQVCGPLSPADPDHDPGRDAQAPADSAPSLLQRRCADPAVAPVHALPDHVEWLSPTHFRPCGRRDGVVQVGGVNVDPGQVARRLLGHPAVAEACVRLHDTPHGPRLKAFIVPHADTGAMKAQSDGGAHAGDAAIQALQQEIEAWCRRQFTPAARPMHIRIGPQLPRNEMGKRCDWPLQG